MFSSIKLIFDILNRNNFKNSLEPLLKRDIKIKILTDDIDEHLFNQITAINRTYPNNPIQLGYTYKLGKFNEMVIIYDNKYLFQMKYDCKNKLVTSFSNEEHNILVQEILFEKYWNEVNGIAIVTW